MHCEPDQGLVRYLCFLILVNGVVECNEFSKHSVVMGVLTIYNCLFVLRHFIEFSK